MDINQRKAELDRIQKEDTPIMTGVALMYHGQKTTFNVYRIDLDYLIYNKYNGRIAAEVKSYERQHHELQPDDPEDFKTIGKMLMDSRPEANLTTRNSLLRETQHRFGIVTADGTIVDGNRRACLLNDIYHDPKIDLKDKSHTKFFDAIILPVGTDRKELLQLETLYQMGEDPKVDYAPIAKYLKARDLKNEGFSNEDIASMMGCKKNDVKMYLGVLELIDEYLDTYDYTGIYTMWEGKEDQFQKLYAALNGYKNGVSNMWAYDVQVDVSDLKSICFDYIRAGTLDQFQFRDIIRKPTKDNALSSIFSNEAVWKEFSETHFEITDNIPEKKVDELIAENPDVDTNRLLVARDKEWAKHINEKLRDNYKKGMDRINNIQQVSQPEKLLQKALSALQSVDANNSAFKKTKNKECLEQLEQCIKQLVNAYESL